MKAIHVHIKEKDKGSKDLTLYNLRDEIVNFLYKDTIANSTRADFQFYVFLYFAILRTGEKSFVEIILDEAIPKFDKLIAVFKSKQGHLQANEYHSLVVEHGLEDVFERDIFFVLLDTIINIDIIEQRFGDLYSEDEHLTAVVEKMKTVYRPRLQDSFEAFASSKITDDRYDDDGNYHDLSKSVFRTIRMRTSRNLELNLQRYASIKSIKSESPVDLSFIQYIDPQIIFELWDKYHVAEYMRGTLKKVDDSGIVSGLVVHGVIVLSTKLIRKYRSWKNINGAKDRREKKRAKEEFEQAKMKEKEGLEVLNAKLVESVLASNKRLSEEINVIKAERTLYLSKEIAAQDKDEIKRLNERISKLENLEVTTKAAEKKE